MYGLTFFSKNLSSSSSSLDFSSHVQPTFLWVSVADILGVKACFIWKNKMENNSKTAQPWSPLLSLSIQTFTRVKYYSTHIFFWISKKLVGQASTHNVSALCSGDDKFNVRIRTASLVFFQCATHTQTHLRLYIFFPNVRLEFSFFLSICFVI